MYTKKKYSIKDMVWWTRWETGAFILIAFTAVLLYEVAGMRWLHLPWTPIALIGTAVAFLIGFQNNAAYGRIWEARKIWGGIVNYSRSWAMLLKDMVSNEYAQVPATKKELSEHKHILIYRHIAWMTALRHAMRQRKPWEVFIEQKSNREWYEMIHIPERDNKLEDELRPLLSEEELNYVLKKTNKAATLLSLQSNHLKSLKDKGNVWEFSFLELENILVELFNLQGKSERIKNFPYPRQYATLTYDFVWVFILLLPFGVIPEFSKIGADMISNGTFPGMGKYFVWGSIPFIALVSWIFHTMQRIGTVGENPFEGSANDVPISSISRGIEIDLREMLDENEETIPKPYPVVNGVQM